MSRSSPGRLLASGRAADVYEIDDRWVLRRYRTDFPSEPESEVMRYARDRGFPVPEVREANGTDLVIERLDGRTVLDDMSRRPWTIDRNGRLLGVLHDRLHAIPAPPGLPAPLGGGDVLIHRDLHLLNVMLTSQGPIVIDWSNAARGHGAADAAETWIMLATHLLPGALNRALAAVGRGAFLRAFCVRSTATSSPATSPPSRKRAWPTGTSRRRSEKRWSISSIGLPARRVRSTPRPPRRE